MASAEIQRTDVYTLSRESGVRSQESGVGSQESGVKSRESRVGSHFTGCTQIKNEDEMQTVIHSNINTTFAPAKTCGLIHRPLGS
jgi:hypothetical protein